MKTFKFTQCTTVYAHAEVEAETAEEAKALLIEHNLKTEADVVIHDEKPHPQIDLSESDKYALCESDWEAADE